jgi:hypothetical protein
MLSETFARCGERDGSEGIGEAMGEAKEKALNWDDHIAGKQYARRFGAESGKSCE